MKYKMIVSDYDKTLCNSKKIVTPRTRAAIKQYISSGGRFVICTTRPYIGIANFARELGLKDEIIANQGATIRNLSDDSVVFQSLFTHEEAREVLEIFQNRSAHAFLVSDCAMKTKKNDCFSKICIKSVSYPIDKTRSTLIDDCEKMDVSQIIVGSYFPRKVKKMIEQAQNKFGDKYEIGLCDKYLLNVTQKGISKGKAIEEIAKLHGIEKQEIIAFGDSLNDSSMFEHAGTGVAMGNAMKGLKQIATTICGDVEDDGLAEFIEKNILDTKSLKQKV
ncbi:MAG: HAD family phosphatase [Clostridia bacterium]|nr:HAD family phosphatase [Clostridia bacterium]